MLKFTRLMIKFPALTILLNLLITAFFAFQLKNMEMDPDITNSLPQDIPAKRLYDKMSEIFPSKEFVFLGVEHENVFSSECIAEVDELTKDIESFPEIYQVMSPTNISIISGTMDGMNVETVLSQVPQTDREIEAYRQRLLSSDMALGNLLARDTSAMGMMIFLKNDVDNGAFAEKFLHYTESRDKDPAIRIFTAGKSIASHYIGVGMQRDMGTFFGGGILVIFILMIVIFRNIRGVAIPLTVVIFSVIWTLGLMVMLGYPLSHSITILPILIMAIAVADSIHILTHYMQNSRQGGDRRTVVLQTMEDMNSPVIMTSLTTMAGFISLGTVSATSIMELGLFTAAGVFFAMVLSLSMVPAVLALLKLPNFGKGTADLKIDTRTVQADKGLIQRFAESTVAFSVRYAYLLALLLLIITVIGFSRLSHDSSSIENFDEDHPVRIAHDKVNELFAGSNSFQIMFEGSRGNMLKEPRILKDMDELRQSILASDKVGDTQSLADFIKKFNKVLNEDQEEFYRIPDEMSIQKGTDWVEHNGEWIEVEREFEVPGRELIAQYLQLYEMSGKPDDMANLVDYAYRNAKMSVFINDDRASALRAVDAQISEFIDGRFEGMNVAVTGMAKLILVVDQLIVEGQIYSIITSLILVCILTSLMFRSVMLGLFSTIPLFFALILNFIIMGLTGIPINLETMITSSIAIGVGVDYAIHLVYRYRLKYKESGDYEKAYAEAFRDSGLAIAFNSFVVATGFSIIAFSQFVAVAYMGILITLTMISSAIGALIVLPVIFIKFEPKIFKR